MQEPATCTMNRRVKKVRDLCRKVEEQRSLESNDYIGWKLREIPVGEDKNSKKQIRQALRKIKQTKYDDIQDNIYCEHPSSNDGDSSQEPAPPPTPEYIPDFGESYAQENFDDSYLDPHSFEHLPRRK
jgi:hypothetical protein